MAGKNDAFEYAWLVHIFNGTAISNINTTGGTTQLWMGLHTADPGDAGSTASEGGYAAYARVATERAVSGGWTVTSGTSATVASASPTAAITFAQVATTTTGTFSYFSVYPSSSSVGSAALYSGAISPVINFSQNVTPSITTGSSITED